MKHGPVNVKLFTSYPCALCHSQWPGTTLHTLTDLSLRLQCNIDKFLVSRWPSLELGWKVRSSPKSPDTLCGTPSPYTKQSKGRFHRG